MANGKETALSRYRNARRGVAEQPGFQSQNERSGLMGAVRRYSRSKREYYNNTRQLQAPQGPEFYYPPEHDQELIDQQLSEEEQLFKEPGQEVSPLAAGIRALAANYAFSKQTEQDGQNRGMVRRIVNRVANPDLDQIQDAALKKVRPIYERLGIERTGETIVSPTLENIAKDVEVNLAAIRSARSRMAIVEKGTAQLVNSLYAGIVTDSVEPSQEERNLAQTLEASAPYTTAEDLRNILYSFVHDRAQAVAVARRDAEQTRIYRQVESIFDALTKVKVNRWYITDFLSSAILLTAQEKERFRDTIWGLTPTGIHFKFVGNVDTLVIPYSDITTAATAGSSTADFFMMVNRVLSADVLNGLAGRLLRVPMEHFTKKEGGTIKFSELGSDHRGYEIFVRDPWKVKSLIELLVDEYRKTQMGFESMRANISDARSAVPQLIRPQVVRSLLSDPTILEVNTHYDANLRRRKDLELEDINAEIRAVQQKMTQIVPEGSRVISRAQQAALAFHQNELRILQEARRRRQGSS